MKKNFVFLLASMVIVACSQEKTTPTLSLDQTSIEFSAAGGSKVVKVQTNTDWTITTDGADWYTISPTEGNGDTEVTITLDEYTDVSVRTAQIKFEADGLVESLAILQNRPEVPENPAELSYSVRAYAQDYTITAPKGFTYKTILEGEGISIVSSDAENVVLHFEANTTGQYKDFSVIFLTTDDKKLEQASLRQSWRNVEPGELLLDEIFFSGFIIPESNNSDSVSGDQYIKITNTTNETLYADGVIFAVSETNSQVSSTGAYWAYPDLPNGIGVNTLYKIPGNGTDVPVEAGKSVVLAISAQNFKSENGVGCDLSKADFEFYDEGNEDYPDTDNPDVTNLVNWFKSSWSFTSLHDRGYESYAIALAPAKMTSEIFMKEQVWSGMRVMDFNGYHFEDEITGAYIIPNDWVLDAVNCAVFEDLGTLAFNATVDAGYTNVSTIDRDPNRFGKSVIRKRDAAGKIVDTNNSTNDFEICLAPTMR
mgnify:CR=1 FL=1